MRIMGIDPGFATIGIGILDIPSPGVFHVVDWMTIETAAGLPFGLRLQDIRNDILSLIDEFTPDLAVMEKLFFAKNETTALDVAHARGVLLCSCVERGIEVIEPNPMQLKSGITGDGKADKRQMQDMMVRMLNLNEIPKPDDAADALCLAVYGALLQRTSEITL